MLEFFKGTVTARDWAAVAVIVGGTALLCVGFYFIIYGSQQKTLDEITDTDRQVQADLKVARHVKEHIQEHRDEARKMNELVTQFEERLPESREIPTLLKQFEGFAREIGLRVELEQLNRVTEATKETIPYDVKARGDFHEIVSFINHLERHKRYLKVSDLNIGEEEEGVAEASFTLSTYRFIQAPEEEDNP